MSLGAVLVERGDPLAGGTNCGLAGRRCPSTKATIACLAGPSFHEGSGSVCASACAPEASEAARISARADRENETSLTGSSFSLNRAAGAGARSRTPAQSNDPACCACRSDLGVTYPRPMSRNSELSVHTYWPGRAYSIWSKSLPRLRLEPRAGGNSLSVASSFATSCCAGAIRNMRLPNQWRYIPDWSWNRS